MYIGFIGLGSMGLPIARNLLDAGYDLIVNDINPDSVEELLTLGAETGDYKTIGERSSIVFTMLPDSQTVSEVLFGNDGVIEGLKNKAQNTIVCDMSNVAASFSQVCYNKLKAEDVSFLDAPVLGEVEDAEKASLTMMVGGDYKVFKEIKPLFKRIASNINYLGPSGSGSITKLANQMIVNLNLAAIAEAFILTSKFGTDPMKVFEAIREGTAKSSVLETKSSKIFSRDFSAGEKISTSYNDIKNALDTAHDYGVPLMLTPHLYEIQNAQMIEGDMDDDHSCYIRFYEHLADCMVGNNVE